MFRLEAKDSHGFISDFEQLMVAMTWSTETDFDLFAVYHAKNGQKGIVYYNDMGDLNAFPFIKLSGDAGTNDSGGDNEESLVIVSLHEMKYVWLCCWDYPKVEVGQPGRFAGSDLTIKVMDDKGNDFVVPLVFSGQANVACIAKIDNSSPISIKLVNSSRSGVMSGLDANAIFEIVGG